MKELQTILGTDIPLNTRGIFYGCKFENLKLTVVGERLFKSSFDALECYANIPNPESQLITGKTYDDLINNMHILHKNIKDPEWLKELEEQL